MFAQLFATDTNMTRIVIQWVFLLVIFMFVFPKLYLYQMFAKVEAAARKLEAISVDGQKIVVGSAKKFGKKGKEARKIVSRFIDFFMIPPVSLDPFGILKKMEHLIDRTEERFRVEAKKIAPRAGEEQSMNVYMGLQAMVMIHTIAKIIRHYVELAKKFKNLQFIMILQMQLPLIIKIVESEFKGLNAFLKGKAIGDGIGPLVIASMLGEPGKETAQDVLVKTEERWGRKLSFVRARGPGGRLGKLGKAVEDLCAKGKIAKIVTIDAAQKLEGEKTGTVSEGIGVAIGGAGIQRAKIEEIATKKNIPVDAIAIKMSPFEAISPMPEKVVSAIDNAKELLKERVATTKKGEHIIVVGVGNSCGIPNTNKALKDIVERIKKEAKRQKELEDAKKKGFFKRKKENNGPGAIGEFYSFITGFWR